MPSHPDIQQQNIYWNLQIIPAVHPNSKCTLSFRPISLRSIDSDESRCSGSTIKGFGTRGGMKVFESASYVELNGMFAGKGRYHARGRIWQGPGLCDKGFRSKTTSGRRPRETARSSVSASSTNEFVQNVLEFRRGYLPVIITMEDNSIVIR